MAVFYDDALAGVSAISTLTSKLDGKFLVRNRCLKPFREGKSFDEGVTLKLTDDSGREENMVVSFIPFFERKRTSADENSMLRNWPCDYACLCGQ